MLGTWAPDPTGRNHLRWFNGSVWTDHVSNNGRVSIDPMTFETVIVPEVEARYVSRGSGSDDDRPVGVIGGLAGIAAGYAVLVYLGIPSGLVLFFFPPLGIVMCGLTVWLAIRARRRVSRATQRGVDAAAIRLAQFLAELRSYESKWGAWTPPGSDEPSGESVNLKPSAYEVLGVSEGASPQEVKAAFHRLMLAVHPDRHVNKSPEERTRMEDQAKVITEAYNALKN